MWADAVWRRRWLGGRAVAHAAGRHVRGVRHTTRALDARVRYGGWLDCWDAVLRTLAGDLVTQKAVAAVAAGELAGALVVLYLEQCCRPGRDWLLMALLPNAIAVVVYTGLRDLGVLMRVQYGHVDKNVQEHYRRRSFMSKQQKLDAEIALLEQELGV